MRRMYSKKQIETLAKETIDKAYKFLASIEYDVDDHYIDFGAFNLRADSFYVKGTSIGLESDGLWLSDSAVFSTDERDGSEVIDTSVPLKPSSMPTIVEEEASFEWNGVGEIDLRDLEPYTEYDFESNEFDISGGEDITFMLPSFVKFVIVTGETTAQIYDHYFEMKDVQLGTEFGPEGATLTILITDCIAYVLYSY